MPLSDDIKSALEESNKRNFLRNTKQNKDTQNVSLDKLLKDITGENKKLTAFTARQAAVDSSSYKVLIDTNKSIKAMASDISKFAKNFDVHNKKGHEFSAKGGLSDFLKNAGESRTVTDSLQRMIRKMDEFVQVTQFGQFDSQTVGLGSTSGIHINKQDLKSITSEFKDSISNLILGLKSNNKQDDILGRLLSSVTELEKSFKQDDHDQTELASEIHNSTEKLISNSEYNTEGIKKKLEDSIKVSSKYLSDVISEIQKVSQQFNVEKENSLSDIISSFVTAKTQNFDEQTDIDIQNAIHAKTQEIKLKSLQEEQDILNRVSEKKAGGGLIKANANEKGIDRKVIAVSGNEYVVPTADVDRLRGKFGDKQALSILDNIGSIKKFSTGGLVQVPGGKLTVQKSKKEISDIENLKKLRSDETSYEAIARKKSETRETIADSLSKLPKDDPNRKEVAKLARNLEKNSEILTDKLEEIIKTLKENAEKSGESIDELLEKLEEANLNLEKISKNKKEDQKLFSVKRTDTYKLFKELSTDLSSIKKSLPKKQKEEKTKRGMLSNISDKVKAVKRIGVSTIDMGKTTSAFENRMRPQSVSAQDKQSKLPALLQAKPSSLRVSEPKKEEETQQDSIVGDIATTAAGAAIGNKIGKGASALANAAKKIPKKATLGGLLGGVALDYASEKADEAGNNNLAGSLGVASSAISGAGTGAMIGSVIPGIGTVVGGAVGGILGGAYGLYENWGKFGDRSNESVRKNYVEIAKEKFEVDASGNPILNTQPEKERYTRAKNMSDALRAQMNNEYTNIQPKESVRPMVQQTSQMTDENRQTEVSKIISAPTVVNNVTNNNVSAGDSGGDKYMPRPNVSSPDSTLRTVRTNDWLGFNVGVIRT